MTTDIQLIALLTGSALLLFPVLIFRKLRIPLIRTMLISFVRMSVQLAAIGLVLQFIFGQVNLFVTLGWMLIMLGAAVWTVTNRLNIRSGILLPVLLYALGAASLLVMPWIIIMVVKPAPMYSPVYLIPLYGMVLGNSMNSCALAVERFESNLSDNWKAYHTRIILGANQLEAVLPAYRRALQTSLMPQLLTIASVGIVSLPGMMTGQILGGASPLVAIKYQIMVMIAIFSGVTIGDYLAIRFYIRRRFDQYYLPLKVNKG